MDDVKPYGVSVDIGTTWVTVRVIDIPNERIVLERVVENPQLVAGLDVVTRIKYSLKDRPRSDWLTSVIRESVNKVIQEALSISDIPSEYVRTVVIVGNTVMHHLFYGLPVDSLLRSPYTAHEKDSISIQSGMIGLHLAKETMCYSPPVIESYVGPDVLAVLLASDLLSRTEPSLAIDIGTNTEILLRVGQGLWAASAASGPAFEGMTIECGMPAKDGAIHRVKIDRGDLRPLTEVVGNERPRGICGSGIVSALAEMLRTGILDSIGSIGRDIDSIWLPKNAGATRYLLCQATEAGTGKPVYVSQPDVRLVQQSKAAICAAIDVILDASHLSTNEIQSVYLTGSFGSQIDLRDAYRIGLLPEFTRAQVTQVRGGASLGADIMVADPAARRRAEKAAKSIRYLELLDNPLFESRYADAQIFPSDD